MLLLLCVYCYLDKERESVWFPELGTWTAAPPWLPAEPRVVLGRHCLPPQGPWAPGALWLGAAVPEDSGEPLGVARVSLVSKSVDLTKQGRLEEQLPSLPMASVGG